MTPKEMKTILFAIRNAKAAIEELACENYPDTEFEDEDFREMFYKLNDMCITINEKIDAAEEGATE